MEAVLSFIGVFLASLAVNVLWVMCVQKVQARKPFSAAMCGELTYVLTAFITVKYVNDVVFLVPAILGGFVGTYLTVWQQAVSDAKAKQRPNCGLRHHAADCDCHGVGGDR